MSKAFQYQIVLPQVHDADGNLVDQPASLSSIFAVSDLDETNGYFGFMTSTGAWYILYLTATAARYARGAAGTYAANWAARAGLSYQYYDQVF